MLNLNTARIACAVTIMFGAMWAFTGLLVSLQQFGAGLAVAAAAAIVYGLCDYIESRDIEAQDRYRAEVWHRRDQQNRPPEVHNIYAHRRDGL